MGERAEHDAPVADAHEDSERPGDRRARRRCGALGRLLVRRARRERCAVALASRRSRVPLLVLNVAWYAFIYRIQGDLAPLRANVAALESVHPAGSRITVVVPANAESDGVLSYYGKFWLGDRLTVYWTGAHAPPWYADASGAASDVVARRRRPRISSACPGVEALCPAGLAARGDGRRRWPPRSRARRADGRLHCAGALTVSGRIDHRSPAL